MNTQTVTFALKTLDQILAEQKSLGHPWMEVKPSDFQSPNWSLREVDLSDDSLISEACEEGRHILEGSGLVVKGFLLADEVRQKVHIPWAQIVMFLGVVGLGVGGMYLLFEAVALIIRIIAMVLPVLVLGVAVLGLILVDPVLIALVSDFDDNGNEVTRWIQIAYWYD